MPRAKRFRAEVYEGHKGHWALTVPFDPREAWGVELEPRAVVGSPGCAVSGTMNGVRFEGFIGFKYRRFWILVDGELREELGAAPGEVLEVVVRPRARKAS